MSQDAETQRLLRFFEYAHLRCEREGFLLEKLAVATEVRLATGANVLTIADADSLDRFTERFRLADPPTPSFRWHVYWRDVARRYDGIIIAPCIWDRMLCRATGWYHGWDCASGCVWDPAAVEVVRVVCE